MNSFVPIVIPTLNRYVHLKRCVESLSACIHAEKTELFIFLDYPLKDTHWEGYQLIKAYLPNIKGFKSVKIVEREKNYGPIDNFHDSLKYVFERYNRLIFSEDDNEFAPSFLQFVNNGLEVYKDREDVFSVSGYQYPVAMPMNYNRDAYMWQGFSAWGVGIWKEKWDKVNFETNVALSNVKDFLKNYTKVYRFQIISNHYLPIMIAMIQQIKVHGDGLLSLYLFQNKMYSIFPTISRVRNTGHDGSGFNCGYLKENIYCDQFIYEGDDNCEMANDLKPDKIIDKVMYQHFKIDLKSKIKTFIKLILINCRLFNSKI